jgi:putative DNA primase/helicase
MQLVAPYHLIPGGNFAGHFHRDHLADLRASGLTDDTIRAAGVYSIRPCDIAHFFGRRGVPEEVSSALCFPYQGGDFARIKLFAALGKMKYSQPPGTGARLYMPFAVDDRPFYVCEGEKKTLSAWQHGFNAVGIGGIWNWLSKATRSPIADLNLIRWDGREVTIIPDSDVFNRVDLLRAVYALGRELQSQGATVYVAQIPQRGGAKIGLDDFIVAGGVVDRLEVFALSHRVFRGCDHWHGQWKFQKALQAA